MFHRLLLAVRRQRASPRWPNWSSARSGASAAKAQSAALPAQAQVVICGGGIMGTSVAYHLSKMGWKDIVLLEQGRLAAGSTRFCAGIISTARHLSIEQKMADYSNKLYQQLEQETGIQTGVQIYDRTSVLHVMVKNGQVTGVETDKGQIECQYFVNCAGQDARIGDPGDHEVGELPRDLHTRHEVHHGRVSFGAGLLCPGRNELRWPFFW